MLLIELTRTLRSQRRIPADDIKREPRGRVNLQCQRCQTAVPGTGEFDADPTGTRSAGQSANHPEDPKSGTILNGPEKTANY